MKEKSPPFVRKRAWEGDSAQFLVFLPHTSVHVCTCIMSSKVSSEQTNLLYTTIKVLEAPEKNKSS